MRSELEACLKKEVLKQIRRHQLRLRKDQRLRTFYNKRTGRKAKPRASNEPSHWNLDRQFNPYKVRQDISALAYSLSESIRNERYEPRPSLKIQIPKPFGGKRGINIFTVVDSSVARWLHEKLLSRNEPRFSSYAYAYRSDRTAHHAIDFISNAVRRKERFYVLEYDFKQYFDSISHDYIFEILDKDLRVSPREQCLLKQLLSHSYAEGIKSYASKAFSQVTTGIPQGSTISLFLANVACLELDRELERTGTTFARYADDIVIICNDYRTAGMAASIMHEHSRKCGVDLNLKKSKGITLVTNELQVEMKTTRSFVFLGYDISSRGTSISEASVRRIKRTLAGLIYRHLLKYPLKGLFKKSRLYKGTDWDLVACIMSLRGRLYGKISERDLRNAIGGKGPIRNTRCMLSYYPLVDNGTKFRELDGWLLTTLMKAYEKRRKVIKHLGHGVLPEIDRKSLESGKWYSQAFPFEPSVPSFYLSWLYNRKCYKTYGLRYFPPPQYHS